MMPATLEGNRGRAWLVPCTSTPDQSARVAVWLVEGHGFHIAWHRWLVSVVHLRPIEGVRPAVITRPGASHEFTIWALDPQSYGDHEQLPEAIPTWAILHPVDVAEQFQVPSDKAGEEIAQRAVESILVGAISPDQDFRRYWASALEATAERYRTEARG